MNALIRGFWEPCIVEHSTAFSVTLLCRSPIVSTQLRTFFDKLLLVLFLSFFFFIFRIAVFFFGYSIFRYIGISRAGHQIVNPLIALINIYANDSTSKPTLNIMASQELEFVDVVELKTANATRPSLGTESELNVNSLSMTSATFLKS